MMTRDQAEILALQAIAYVLSEEQSRDRFLRETGIDPATLRASADDPALLAGVLDFLLQDEALLLAFCDHQALPPEAPARARALFPGGGVAWP